jgi:hypothetical protein
MIRTLIEVSHENEWQHKRQLEETLAGLGFVPRPSEDHIRWTDDLHRALDAKGIDVRALVEEYRKSAELSKAA